VLGGLNVGKKGATDVNIGTVANDLLVVAMPAAPTTPAYVNDFASRPQLQQQMPQPVPVAAAPVSPIGAHERGVVVQRSIYPSLPSPAAAGGYWVGTIGDKLAARFTFVEHVSRFNEARVSSASNAVFDYNMPLVFGTSVPREESDTSRFVEMTREGAVHVAFRPSSNVMERYLGENNTSSVDLLSAIRLIDGTPDTRVAQVVVVGFSSPEGTNDEKQSYAMERAMAVRDYLTANSHIDPGVISVYNGSVDWTTLRALVAESNMAQKYTVLDIIDNAPAWDAARGKGRLDRLMAIDGGKTYRYMREKFFPLIRQTGAYVKVYYENR
jgi:hypothetical protein